MDFFNELFDFDDSDSVDTGELVLGLEVIDELTSEDETEDDE